MQRLLFTIFCALCLWVSSFQAFAQKQDYTESLLKDLSSDKYRKDDTNKVNLLNKLADAYFSVKPDKGLLYGRQSMELAERLGWMAGIVKACSILGNYSISKHEYLAALDYFSRCLKISEEQGNKRGQATYLKNIGALYATNLHDLPKALDYFTRSLKINEDLGDKREISETLAAMGTVCYGLGDYANAMDHYRQAQKINEGLGDKKSMAETLEAIGRVYCRQKDFTNALDYATRSLKLSQELNDKRGIAIRQLNIGTIYNTQNDRAKALDNWLSSLKIFNDVGEKSYMGQDFQNIAALYYGQGDYAKSLEFSSQAYKTRQEIGDRAGMAISMANMGNDYQAIATGKVTALPDSLSALSGKQLLQRAQNCMVAAIDLQKEKDDFDLLSTTCLHLSQVQSLLGDSLGSRESFRKYNNYIAGVYNQDKRKDVSIKDMQDVFAQKQENMQEDMEHNALEYEYEKKQAEAKTEIERQQLKYEEELKQKQITYEYAQKQMELEKKLALDKAEQEKKDAIAAEKIIEAKKQRDYLLIGLGMLAIITLGIINRVSVLRRVKKTLEHKNMQIAEEKENADKSRIRAENSERFKQQFLANMSHEIRTPMNAVSGMTELLLDKNPRPDQLTQLQAISKSSDILLHILNDILDLSKIEAGKMEIESIDFSLADTTKQVIDTLSHKADDKGLQLVACIDDDVPDVLVGDPYRLNQVLINLGGNAIKFTDKGGVEIHVKTTGREKGKVSLQFSITDTGIGIPEDKQKNLFESFTQVNSSDTRKYGGTGLGLSISKQLVELQGGTIAVESIPGSGTTFSFILAYPLGSAQKLRQRDTREKKTDGTILNGLRILVADDNEYNRMVVKETLMLKAEVVIEEAVNGLEAVQMMEQNDYDVILMDVQMPVMNGIDATRYIREKLPRPKNQIPIVALTASILRFDIDRCMQSGMNSYVPKPFKAWQLIGTLADVTGKKLVMPTNTPTDGDYVPAHNSEPADGSVIDLTYLTKFCEGDEERMKKFVSLYLQGVPAFKEKIAAAVAAKDFAAIAKQIHSYKPNWMIMGMKSTSELGIKIEHQCADKNTNVYDHLKLLLEQTDKSVIELGGDH